MAKQTFTVGQVLTADQMTSLQQTAMGGGSATAKTASYTLVAADAGTTVIMNSASATTVTVNTSLFAAGDTVFIVNQGAGICTVTAGTATVSTASSLALSQYETGELYFLSTSAAIFSEYTQATSAGGGMTVLASGSLSGTSLDLTLIDQTYTNLVLEIIDANWATSNDYFKLRFNNLSTSIYTTVAQGSNDNGATASFYGAGSADRLIVWGGVTLLRTGKNSIYLTIPDYTTVKGRRDIFGNVFGQNSTPNETAVFWTGFSTDTTAISRITFSTQTGLAFSSGSYKLYGVK